MQYYNLCVWFFTQLPVFIRYYNEKFLMLQRNLFPATDAYKIKYTSR